MNVTFCPPLLSVILPVYNGERFIAAAITSILQQAYRPIEILVIDDGSTDRTAAIVQQFGQPVHYLYRSNGGPAAARNTGLTVARGAYIAFLDADDFWSADSLQHQFACLAANPTAGIALGCLQVLVETQSPSGELTFQPWSTPQRLLILQCALVRRTVFDQLGPLDERYFSAEDIDWFLRVREAGIPIVTHAATTVFVRRHRHNLTNQQASTRHELALAIKRSLERRQASQGAATLPALRYWPGPSHSHLPSDNEGHV